MHIAAIVALRVDVSSGAWSAVVGSDEQVAVWVQVLDDLPVRVVSPGFGDNLGRGDAAGDSGSSGGVAGGKPHVYFPASSPHVLACGVTKLKTSGDTIVVDIPARTLTLDVEVAVLERRRAAQPAAQPRPELTGWLARYVKLVSGAEKGAVLQ